MPWGRSQQCKRRDHRAQGALSRLELGEAGTGTLPERSGGTRCTLVQQCVLPDRVSCGLFRPPTPRRNRNVVTLTELPKTTARQAKFLGQSVERGLC